MNRPALRLALVFLSLALGCPAQAQQVKKAPRIGFLAITSPRDMSLRMAAFRHGLRELGYIEGKTIVVDDRYAEGKLDRLRSMTAELVQLKADVIVTSGPIGTRTAKEATATLPIVMAYDNDPVASGFVASLARPGGNITGLSTHYPEITGKQLELLKEIVPKMSHLAVLGDSSEPFTAQSLKETERAAKAFGVQLQYLDVKDPKDVKSALEDARKSRADAAVVLASAIFISQRSQLAELAVKNRLPAVYQASEYVEAGGLMTYGASITDLFRRAATYVDRILKGAKPAEIPVEQPTTFELIINLKAAREIGLKIPPNVLARADRVIR
ncbi:MAG: transporter substrate-binding protein [Deltaproteobacteria bacterium]|jgi:putative ABC transport system substrate-binding protein|nr:transporter substrate-binding protein [Deltaproteobacteria bacterium]